MAKVKISEPQPGLQYLRFHCPGCKKEHVIPIDGDSPRWAWNGSLDAPTITPSLATWTRQDASDRCHSNVTDGAILFHADSKHSLSGQTVPLPEIP